MIGSGLVRFHPDRKQTGDGMWQEIKKRGPTLLRDVLTETAMEGIKGLGKAGPVHMKGWPRRSQERSQTRRQT